MRALLIALLLTACSLPPGTQGNPFIAWNDARGGGRMTTTGTSNNTSEVASWDIDDSFTYGFGMTLPMAEHQTEGPIRVLTGTLASFARDAVQAMEALGSTLHVVSGQLAAQHEDDAKRHAEIMAALQLPEGGMLENPEEVAIGAGGALGALGMVYLIVKRFTKKDDE